MSAPASPFSRRTAMLLVAAGALAFLLLLWLQLLQPALQPHDRNLCLLLPQLVLLQVHWMRGYWWSIIHLLRTRRV